MARLQIGYQMGVYKTLSALSDFQVLYEMAQMRILLSTAGALVVVTV